MWGAGRVRQRARTCLNRCQSSSPTSRFQAPKSCRRSGCRIATTGRPTSSKRMPSRGVLCGVLWTARPAGSLGWQRGVHPPAARKRAGPLVCRRRAPSFGQACGGGACQGRVCSKRGVHDSVLPRPLPPGQLDSEAVCCAVRVIKQGAGLPFGCPT